VLFRSDKKSQFAIEEVLKIDPKHFEVFRPMFEFVKSKCTQTPFTSVMPMHSKQIVNQTNSNINVSLIKKTSLKEFKRLRKIKSLHSSSSLRK
jgi:hypothetical protein